MINWLAVWLFLYGLFAAIVPVNSATQPPPPIEGPPGVLATLGQAVTLAPGQEAYVDTTGVTVRLEGVPNDGRCPSDVECVATLPVEVALTVYGATAEPVSLNLSAHTDGEGQVDANAPGGETQGVAGDYTMTLNAVTPYPLSTALPASDDYRVTLTVSETGTETEPATGDQGSSGDTGTTGATGDAGGVIDEMHAPVSVGVDEPFQLHFGSRGTVDDRLELTFLRVPEDSRCPLDVQCFWSGMAVVALDARLGDRVAQTVQLGGATDSDGLVTGAVNGMEATPKAMVGSYEVELLAVRPYPAQANARPADADYTISLVVHRPRGSAQPQPTATPALTAPQGETNLPLVCWSEKAVAEWTAGVTQEAPLKLTEALDAKQLDGKAGLDAFCAQQFGADWHAASFTDKQDWWSEFAEPGTLVWLWMDLLDEPLPLPL